MAYDWACKATVSIERIIGTPTIVDGYIIDNGIETYGESYGSVTAKDGDDLVCQIDFTLEGLDPYYMESALNGYHQAKHSETYTIDVSHDFDDLIYDIEDFYDNDIEDYNTVYQVMRVLTDMVRDEVYAETPSDSTEVEINVVRQPPLR